MKRFLCCRFLELFLTFSVTICIGQCRSVNVVRVSLKLFPFANIYFMSSCLDVKKSSQIRLKFVQHLAATLLFLSCVFLFLCYSYTWMRNE